MDDESSDRSNGDTGAGTNRGNESNGNINSDVNGSGSGNFDGSRNIDGSGRDNIRNGNRPQVSDVVPHVQFTLVY